MGFQTPADPAGEQAVCESEINYGAPIVNLLFDVNIVGF